MTTSFYFDGKSPRRRHLRIQVADDHCLKALEKVFEVHAGQAKERQITLRVQS